MRCHLPDPHVLSLGQWELTRFRFPRPCTFGRLFAGEGKEIEQEETEKQRKGGRGMIGRGIIPLPIIPLP